MKRTVWLCMGVVFCLAPVLAQQGQQQAATSLGGATSTASVSSATVAVPPLVNFSGVLTEGDGKPLSGIVGVTFYLYKDSQGGAPLWIETQNVHPDKTGHYSVMLGSTTSQGLPADLFASGEAHWLGVQIQGQEEQPRVMLLSVPYAMKAADAETVGGLPASAFVLAAPPSSASSNSGTATAAGAASSSAPSAVPPASSVTGSGITDFLPLWTSSSNIGNSVLFQSGTGSTAKVGINTTTPGATLDVKGGTNIEGLLDLPATGTATSSGGKNSQPQDFVASSYNSSTAAAVNQTFQWRAEAAGNNTSTPSGTLNLLFGSGTSSPAETGLKLNNKGLFTFATGQTFPGTGTLTGVTTASGSGLTGGGTSGTLKLGLLTTCATNQVLEWNGSAWVCTTVGGGGTITGVTAGTDLSGGGTTGNVTLNLNVAATDARYAQLGISNSFAGNETVSGNISAGGTVSGSAVSGSAVSGHAVATFSGSTDTILIVTQNGSGDGMDIFNSGSAGIAVVSSGPSAGGIAVINSSVVPALYAENDDTFSSDNFVFETNSTSFQGQCAIDLAGNFGCTGTKSAVVPVSGERKVALYAVEAPENWFEDFGSDRLSGGVATILLEPTFAETVNTDMEYHVFLTPKGDCKGLFVSNETASSFEVHEMGGGTSNVAFDYRIVAKRKAYESIRLADMTKKFQRPNLPRSPKAVK